MDLRLGWNSAAGYWGRRIDGPSQTEALRSQGTDDDDDASVEIETPTRASLPISLDPMSVFDHCSLDTYLTMGFEYVPGI